MKVAIQPAQNSHNVGATRWKPMKCNRKPPPIPKGAKNSSSRRPMAKSRVRAEIVAHVLATVDVIWETWFK